MPSIHEVRCDYHICLPQGRRETNPTSSCICTFRSLCIYCSGLLPGAVALCGLMVLVTLLRPVLVWFPSSHF